MKRRSKSWLIAALVAVAAVMVLTGCSLSQVQTLTIVDYPATTYEVGTTPAIEFTVEALMDDGETRTLTYNEYSSILKLSGFSTEEIGSFTATVTYRNVSATFDYEVVGESEDFAGGVGTETNPYIINTSEQFKKIGNTEYKSKYFKMSSDIALTEADVQGKGYWSPAIINSFSGTLDGNGYKITVSNGGELIALFGTASNITLLNLDVYSVGHVTIVDDLYGKSTFSDVDRYGDMVFQGDNNIGMYAIYSNTNCDLTMENCDNYVNIKGSALYVSAYIGYPMTNSQTKITFTDCVNYGNLMGQMIGVIFANSSQVKGGKITLTGCKNEGTVVGIEQAEFYFATGQNEEKLAYFEDDNKAVNLEDPKISVPESVLGLEVTTAEDGKISVTKDDSIAYVIVRGYFYASTDNGTLVQMKDEALSFTDNNATATQIAKIKVAPVTDDSTGTIGNAIETWTPADKYYFAPYEENGKTYSIAGEVMLNVFVLAFDTDGELVGGCKV